MFNQSCADCKLKFEMAIRLNSNVCVFLPFSSLMQDRNDLVSSKQKTKQKEKKEKKVEFWVGGGRGEVVHGK